MGVEQAKMYSIKGGERLWLQLNELSHSKISSVFFLCVLHTKGKKRYYQGKLNQLDKAAGDRFMSDSLSLIMYYTL